MGNQAATELKEVKRQAEKLGDRIADRATRDDDNLSEEFARLREQFEELASTLTSQARSTAEAAAHTAGAAARRASRKAEAGYETAVDQAAEAYAEAERFAADRPAVTLGLAAGVGLLAGLMLARR